MGDVRAADAFLRRMLYECTPQVGREVLSERNMALKILTEILMCEKNKKTGMAQGDTWGSCGGYDGFFDAYQRIKRAVRRIWFGLSDADVDVGFAGLSDINMSADMLAVIAKYSVPPQLWGDVFSAITRISAIPSHLRDGVESYLAAMRANGAEGSGKCCAKRRRHGVFETRRIDYKNRAEGSDAQAAMTSPAPADENAFAIIYCTNDEGYAAECRKYIEYMALPDGMRGEVIEVVNAPSMAAGYNYAMANTAAKYKIYIHHDTMLIRSDIPRRLVEMFRESSDVGVAGVFGTTNLPESGKWAQCAYEDSVLTLWQDAMLDFIRPKETDGGSHILDAEAIDGAFIATSTDIPWREDIFDGWHYYDIGQCFDARAAGSRTVLIADANPWILHESTLRKDPEGLYDKYCEIFKKGYLG